jgi:hypothetical protein
VLYVFYRVDVHPNTYLTEPSNCCVTVGSQCTTPPAIPYVRVCPSRCSFARGAHPTAQSCSMHVLYTYRSPSSWTDAPTVSLTSSEREVPSGWVRMVGGVHTSHGRTRTRGRMPAAPTTTHHTSPTHATPRPAALTTSQPVSALDQQHRASRER